MHMTIGRATTTLGAAVLALFLMMIVSGRYELGELRIGSPAYQRIGGAKDFVSDLSAPPLSLLDAYLEIETSERGAVGADHVATRLAELRKSYDERRAFWAASPVLPASLKSLASGAAAGEADRFWEQAQGVYLPALERNDRVAMTASLAKISAIFAERSELVKQQVEAARAFARSAESEAASLGAGLDELNMAISLAGAAFLFAVLLVVKRKLVAPIVDLSSYATRLAREPVAEAPPCGHRSDEIGQMNAAVEVFKEVIEKVHRAEKEAAESRAKVAEQMKDREAGAKWYIENRDFFFKEYTNAMERLSAGDLEARLNKEFIKDYEKLREQFNRAAERMQSAMQSIVATCGTIDASTRDISQAAEHLSRRNEEQASTLAETASAVDQITNTVKKTADNAIEARHIVDATKVGAAKSEKVVGEAIEAMGGIETSSEQISQIIGVIDEIAFQTNLLALNAGVEAARAGEAGRGFAVVATEVRALAQRSAEAAKGIKALISASNAKVQDGVALVAETGASLRRIVGEVTKISFVVTEIAASAEAQSNGLRDVNAAVKEIDQVTQKNASMSEEMNAASQSLANDSAELSSLIGRFRIGAASSRVSGAATAAAMARPAVKRAAISGPGGAVRAVEAASRNQSWGEF
ncbi:MAG: HAMP domain-containing protein [Methylocystis sp.]|nr:HAMP domain-containing protein [Methylocystis sp.]